MSKKLTDDDILSEVRYQLSQASGSEFASDELVQDRTNALKYYMGKPRGDEIEGRSTIISKDVADMIDSMLTQIMPTFTMDNIVQFEPMSEQDEEQARVESNFCNYMVMEKNNGYMLLETLIKDALLSKNATAKVYVDVKEDVKKESYTDLTQEELFMVLQPQAKNQEVDITEFNESTGNVKLKRITTTRKLVVDAVAPENFCISSEHRSQFLDDVMYCSERQYVSRGELIDQGFDKDLVYSLPSTTTDTKADSLERNTIDDEQNYFNRETSMQTCEVHEHYIRIDQDGDGVAELHKVLTVENILLSNEEVDFVPYANGVAFLMGHRFYGQSVYDKISEIQDMKTHFLRQWADNALVANHKKYVVVGDQVNMDDLLNGRPNGVIRAENLGAVQELGTTDIGPSCQMALDYYDKVRTDRSGSSLDLQSNQMAMPSNVGDQGVNTLIANLEKVTALATNNLSETLITSIYRLVHKYLRMYFQEDISAKMGGQWAETNPSQWQERDNVNITVPPTASEKVVQSVALEKAVSMAQQELSMGKEGITTSDGQVYQMKIDHLRMSGIDHPEKYFIDPDSPQAMQVKQQNQQAQQQQQMEQQQMMMQQAQQQAELQNQMIQTQIAEIKRNWTNDVEQLQFDYAELSAKLEMDKYKADLKADGDEAKTVGDNVNAIAIESMKQTGKMLEENNETEESRTNDQAEDRDSAG